MIVLRAESSSGGSFSSFAELVCECPDTTQAPSAPEILMRQPAQQLAGNFRRLPAKQAGEQLSQQAEAAENSTAREQPTSNSSVTSMRAAEVSVSDASQKWSGTGLAGSADSIAEEHDEYLQRESIQPGHDTRLKSAHAATVSGTGSLIWLPDGRLSGAHSPRHVIYPYCVPTLLYYMMPQQTAGLLVRRCLGSTET